MSVLLARRKLFKREAAVFLFLQLLDLEFGFLQAVFANLEELG